MARKELWLASAFVLATSLACTALACTRGYLSFGPETDYLAAFVTEAQRLLDAQPLRMHAHPPFYSMILALAQLVTRDWVVTGVAVSLASSAVAMGASFALLHRLCGRYAAWGGLIGCTGSALFVSYAIYASSDMFYAALYTSSMLSILVASRSPGRAAWVLSGILIGCTLLTRTNGVTLILLLAAPLVLVPAAQRRFGHVLAAGGGMLGVLGAWVVFALSSGSPLTPRVSHVNLALTYFSPGRVGSAENIELMSQRFHSTAEVLAHNPALMARLYLQDAYHLCQHLFGSEDLLMFPLNLLVLPGLYFLVVASRETRFYMLFALLPQIALINLAAYESRFYLFLVPVFGAAAAELCARLWAAAQPSWIRFATAALLLLGIVHAMGVALVRTGTAVRAQDAELAAVVPQARKLLPAGAVLVARKPHVPFYTGTAALAFPTVSTLDELKDFLAQRATGEAVYLYFGSAERKTRPQLSALGAGDHPDWLVPLARGDEPGEWALYKFEPS